MEALKQTPCDCYVLACPEDCLKTFTPLAEKTGFEIHPGPKEDVLARYAAVIRRFCIDRLIRATGDNPFVFADAAATLNEEAVLGNADYAGYGGLPYGAGVESVAAEALLRADREAALPQEREHVCPYLYNHPETFLLHRPLAPLRWQGPSIRLTVDTAEDYERAKALYAALPGNLSRYQGQRIIRAARLFE
jgi:spore coat polysaccharide biosynthesis protein SpsF